MKAFRTLGLAAAIALSGLGAASAGPLSVMSGEQLGVADHGIEKAAIVCGPYRCYRRPVFRRAYPVRRCFFRPTVFGPRRICRFY